MLKRRHKRNQRGATVVFGVIGAAIGAVVDVANPAQGAMWGWSIGTVVGGLLFPPSMPANSLGKLDDLRVTSSSYGTFIPWFWKDTRTAGQVIWATDLVEHKSGGGGGKGGPSNNTTVYTYTSSFAVLVGRGPLKSIDKILFNQQVVYDTTQTPNTSAGLTISGIYLGDELQTPDAFMTSVLAANGETSPAYRGYAYVVFENVDLTNYGNRLPNIQFETTGFGTISADIMTDVAAQCGLAAPIWTMATAGTSGANGAYTFTSFHDVNGSLVYTNGTNMLYFDDATDDWVIAATVGGTKLYQASGGTWSQIPLTGWTVVTGASPAPACTCKHVDYDFSSATDAILGYINPTRQMGKAVVEPLAMALFADIVETDGLIRWIPRGASPTRTLSIDDLGAVNWSPGSGLDSDTIPVKYKRQQDWEIPSCVQVTYFQWNSNPIARNFLQASQSAIRTTKSDMQNVQQITFPMVMDDTFARQLAESLLYTAWVEQDSFSVEVSQRNSDLIPSDVLFIPHGGLNKRTRVIQSNMAMPGISQLSLVLDDWSPLFQYIQGAPTGGNGSSGSLGSTNMALAFQSNAFNDTIAKQNEVHLWLAAAWTQASTPGRCTVYISMDGGTSYQRAFGDIGGLGNGDFRGSKGIPSTMGNCLSALGTWSDYTMMDTTNTLQITLAVPGQQLESCSMADLANGTNALWINNEIVQFETATHISGDTYEISNLLRGQRGTDPFMSTHSTGEIAVLVESSLGMQVLFPPPLGGDPALGSNILVKFVFPGQSLSGVTPQTVTLDAPELRPYRVANLSGSRDIPGNLTITWTGRKRFDGYYPYSVGAADEPIQYGIGIYTDGTYSTLVRGASFSSPTYSYSAADQTTDFGSPQATVYIKVHQYSHISSVGEGYQWQGTV